MSTPFYTNEPTLGEGEVALVCEGRVHQLGGVSLVLIGIFKLCVHHSHGAQPVLLYVVSGRTKEI